MVDCGVSLTALKDVSSNTLALSLFCVILITNRS